MEVESQLHYFINIFNLINLNIVVIIKIIIHYKFIIRSLDGDYEPHC